MYFHRDWLKLLIGVPASHAMHATFGACYGGISVLYRLDFKSPCTSISG